MKITIDATELTKLAADLKGARVLLNNRREPNEKIAKYMADRWTANYASEGGIYGKWPGLAGFTLRDRARRGFGPGPILQRTGSMLSAFIEQSDDPKISTNEIKWLFKNRDHAYLVRHHFGYTQTTSGYTSVVNGVAMKMPVFAAIPARKLWDLNDDDEGQIERIMTEFVDDVLDAAML